MHCGQIITATKSWFQSRFSIASCACRKVNHIATDYIPTVNMAIHDALNPCHKTDFQGVRADQDTAQSIKK